jgi:hypothetical protein
MKKNFLAFLITVFLALIPCRGFSETWTDLKGFDGFDQSILDYHFSRADRELNPGSWMTEARRGLALALDTWDLFAADFYGDPLLAAGAREELLRQGEDELESRFTRWLHRRFFGSEAEALMEKMSGVFGEAHLEYAFHRDEAGEILFDDKTGDPLVVRPQEGRDFERDRENWRKAVEEGLAEGLTAFERNIELRFPELLIHVPEDRRGEFGEKIQSLYAESSFNLRKEFEGLVNREERLLTARRTGDIWSLRKKSDEEAAREITARLIEETNAACAHGIASLEGRIEEAAAGAGDLALAGNEWLAAYREQFERGLKAWQDAEERFFIRRVEWEQEAGKTFQEGEEAWSLAFDQFEEAWRTWELQAKALFESGEAVFQKASENLEAAIQEAKAEFERDARLRSATGAGQARAWVDIYLTSGSVAAAARENIPYWLEKYHAADAPELSSDLFQAWLDNEMKKKWTAAQRFYETHTSSYYTGFIYLQILRGLAANEDLSDSEKEKAEENYQSALARFQENHSLWYEMQEIIDGNSDENFRAAVFEKCRARGIYLNETYSALVEIEKWFYLFNIYQAKALEARDVLVNEFNMVMGSGLLADILSETAASEDFNLDEYQIELIRAKAASAYWDKRLAIAEAVFDYGRELSAGRMTDAEGQKAWESAKAAYDEAVLLYEAEQEQLNKAGAGVREKEAALNAAAARVLDANDRLDELNRQYAALMAVHTVGRGDYALEELNRKYQELLAVFRRLNDYGPGGIYAPYFEQGLILGDARNRELAGDMLKMIITGNGGEKTLAELKETADAVRTFSGEEEIPENMDEYGLDEEDPFYKQIQQLLAEREGRIADLADEADSDPGLAGLVKSRYDELIRLWAVAAKTAAERALDIRLQGLGLFTASSGAAWYFAALNHFPSETEQAALREQGLELRLAEDLEKSRRDLLEARIELETRGLSCFLAGEPEPEPEEEPDVWGEFLSFFCNAESEDAALGLGLLRELRGRILGDEEQFSGEEEKDSFVRWFLSGGSFFPGTGAFLTEWTDAYNRSMGLLEMYQTYGVRCGLGQKETWDQAVRGLADLFSAYGMDAKGVYLPDVENAAARIFARQEDIAFSAAEFLLRLDQRLSGLPEALAVEIEAWKISLIEYMAALAVQSGRVPAGRDFILGEEEILRGRFLLFQETCDSLEYIDEQKARELSRQYEDLRNRGIILDYALALSAEYEKTILLAAYESEEGRKHWRQYIDSKYTGDPEGGKIIPAVSWAEGLLSDARDKGARSYGRVNAIFAMYTARLAEQNGPDYASLIAPYLADQQTAWNEDIRAPTPFLVQDNYFREAGNIQNGEALENLLREEIARLGFSYDFSQKDSAEFFRELERELEKIGDMETLLVSLTADYSLAADDFLDAGGEYDRQYGLVKKTYTDLEEQRFLYETQDAIRRWASTAYLDLETGDLEYCKTRSEKARIVLEVLSGLYASGEERRPYENEEYEILYKKYQESFSKMMLALKVRDTLNKTVAEELRKNEQLYKNYREQLEIFGQPIDYAAPETSSGAADAWVRNYITLKNGSLGFSYDRNFVLRGNQAGNIQQLQAYFENREKAEGEYYNATRFEQALGNLNERMLSWFSDQKKYEQWGLARDYLIRRLIESNSGIRQLSDLYTPGVLLKEGKSLGSLEVTTTASLYSSRRIRDKVFVFDTMVQPYLDGIQKEAWEKMSPAERADLEFYTLLTLSGACASGSLETSGFSLLSARLEYGETYNIINQFYKEAQHRVSQWWDFGFLYIGERDRNKLAADRIWTQYRNVADEVARWQTDLQNAMRNLSASGAAYRDSCAVLFALTGSSAAAGKISWADIYESLRNAEGIRYDEIEKIRSYWEEMLADTGETYSDVPEALTKLVQWARGGKEDAKRDLDNQWVEDELDRREKEDEYHKIKNEFIAGIGDLPGLKESMEAAFGEKAAARKNHLENLEETILGDLGGLLYNGYGYLSEYRDLAGEYVSLISRAYGMRYDAELAAREAEWAQYRADINEKFLDWREMSAQILERGREDWKNGNEKMKAAYKRWSYDFALEYERVSNAWAAAYLAGLEDKEKWVARAAAAAETASSEALLALVGADAEMMARSMDTRIPASIAESFSTADAENLLENLLSAAGINNAALAFGAINNMTSAAAVKVRRGTGGPVIWNAGTARVAAMELARKSSAELAAREAKRLAASARDSADEALRGLAKNVDEANKSFRKSMDKTFVMESSWRRDGGRYIKDIVVHSTLFNPVITEQKIVDGYTDYLMEPVEIKTDLSETYLAALDAFAVQGLIENVYEELRRIGEEIFGIGEEKIVIEKKIPNIIRILKMASQEEGAEDLDEWVKLEDREQNPGKFGAHIGYEPLIREKASKKESLFYDRGNGELGRLLSEYYYWQFSDSIGLAKVATADWDKPLWDSRESVFDAPTIRGVADLLGQVVAVVVSAAAAPVTGFASIAGMMALTTAITVADDFVFNAMDAAAGYKTWDEAGFAFGKSLVIGAASSVIGGVFNGVTGVSEGFLKAGNGLTGMATSNISSSAGKAVVTGAMKGAELMTTGLVTSALGGITYSHQDKWGYSEDIFYEGIKNIPAAALSGMTSTVTAGLMNRGLEGFTGSLYMDGTRLSGFVGGLAGEGINYALGGDFSMNLFNLDLISRRGVKSGLLELHLGRDGARMNFGTGGADVSLGTLFSAARGMEAWAVNFELLASGEEAARTYASQMRTLYSGSAANRNEYEAILAGRTRIIEDRNAEATRSVYDEGTKIKTITLGANALNDGSRFGLNVYFSHESYRDGKDNGAEMQSLERDNAVTGHMETARQLAASYGAGSIDSAMLVEAMLYFYARRQGQTGIQRAILETYDSSADFWRVLKNGDIFDDGRNGEISFENGQETIITKKSRGKQGSLEEFLGLAEGQGFSLLMKDAGFIRENNIWYGEGGTLPHSVLESLASQGIISEEVYKKIKPVEETGNWFTNRLSEMRDGIVSTGNAVKEGFKESVNAVKKGPKEAFNAMKDAYNTAYNSLRKKFFPPDLYTKDGFLTVPNEDSLDFYQKIMTEEIAEKYSLKANNGVYQCNNYVRTTILQIYGQEIYDMVFQQKTEATNAMFDSFKKNPNLERLDTKDMVQIQTLADSGQLILMIYQNTDPLLSGHIAFVGNSNLTLFALEPIGWQQGKKGTSLDAADYWPVLVQAGTNTGVTSINYGTNYWLDKAEYGGYRTRRDYLLTEKLYFYRVKGGK